MAPELDEHERQVVAALRQGPMTANQVAIETGLSPPYVNTLLKGLRKKGRVATGIGAHAVYRVVPLPEGQSGETPGEPDRTLAPIDITTDTETIRPLRSPAAAPRPDPVPRGEEAPPRGAAPPAEAGDPFRGRGTPRKGGDTLSPRREGGRALAPPAPKAEPPPAPAPREETLEASLEPGGSLWRDPLKPGNAYLVEEIRPEGAFSLAQRSANAGRGVLYITRIPPDEMEEKHAIPRKQCRWVSQGEGGLWRLDSAIREAEHFFEKSPRGMVVFEGLDFFTTHYPFVKLAQFMRDLRGLATQHQGTLLVTVNPRALGEKEIAVLAGGMETVKP